MDDHTIEVAETGSPRIRFAERFNVAVPFVTRHLADRADAVAIRTNHGEHVTYRELADQVARAGTGLLHLGLRPGDRLVMIVADRPQFVYAFWGAITAGIVPVPVNTMLRSVDYAYLLNDSAARGILWSPEFAGEVEPALGAAKPGPAVRLSLADFDALRDRSSPHLEPVPTGPGDDCFWLYSSGSTGRPKGAIHRHRDMVVTSELYGRRVLGVTADDVCFSAAKLFFAYGLGNAMTFPMWVGATAVLDDRRPTPETTMETIRRSWATIFYGVPTLYAAQLAAMDGHRPDLVSLRSCVSAGEALPPGILDGWRAATGLSILDGIGSTELLHIFISNTDGDVKPAASGRPVPGYEARIVDGSGDEVRTDESGRLLVRGDSAARAYWNNPEKTAATMLDDGWVDTGDTYVRDVDGYFFYQGRSDDMLKVGGIWCSPFEIEARLIEHPAVLEAAVVGRKDEAGLVKPAAYVVPSDPRAAGPGLVDELKDHCKNGLAPYKYPRWVEITEELPKTATGKIQRFRLRE